MPVIPRNLAAAAVLVASLSGGASPTFAAATACDRQVLMQIDSARISKEADGFLVDAFGVSESAGWSNPTLIVAGQGTDGTVTVDFVACRPEVSAQVLTPVQTRVKLDLDRATTRRIVIRAKTNSMTVEISP